FHNIQAESQVQRITRELHDCVTELSREYRECGDPVTDDNASLNKLCTKLEYMLQFGQKEKRTLMGIRREYWDYFHDCLAKQKGANDGIRFVNSVSELKTAIGKGRAFIRYSLVHQRLADTLQQCFTNKPVTSDWYSTKSPLVKKELVTEMISHLYELNQLPFDLAPRGYDLDAEWPSYARHRRALGASASPAQLWKAPSRSSSINSLASSFSPMHMEAYAKHDSAFMQPLDTPGKLDATAHGHLYLDHPVLQLHHNAEQQALEEQVESLQIHLDQAELRLRREQDRSDALEGERRDVQATALLAERSLLQAVDDARRDKRGLLQENEALQLRLCDLQKMLDESKRDVAMLEGKVSSLEKDAAASEPRADRARAETAFLQGGAPIHPGVAVCDPEGEDNVGALALTAEDRRQGEVLEGNRSDFDPMARSEIAKLRCQLELSEQQLQWRQADVTRLTTEVGELRSRLGVSKEEVQKLKRSAAEQALSSKMQRQELESLKVDLVNVNRVHVEQLLQMKEELGDLEKEREFLLKKKSDYELKLLSNEEENLQLSHCLEEYERKNLEFEERLYKAHEEADELRSQISQIASEKDLLVEKIDSTISEFTMSVQQHGQESEELKLELERLTGENTALMEHVQSLQCLKEANDDLQTHLEKTKEKIHMLQESQRQELSSMKFKMSLEIIDFQTRLKKYPIICRSYSNYPQLFPTLPKCAVMKECTRGTRYDHSLYQTTVALADTNTLRHGDAYKDIDTQTWRLESRCRDVLRHGDRQGGAQTVREPKTDTPTKTRRCTQRETRRQTRIHNNRKTNKNIETQKQSVSDQNVCCWDCFIYFCLLCFEIADQRTVFKSMCGLACKCEQTNLKHTEENEKLKSGNSNKDTVISNLNAKVKTLKKDWADYQLLQDLSIAQEENFNEQLRERLKKEEEGIGLRKALDRLSKSACENVACVKGCFACFVFGHAKVPFVKKETMDQNSHIGTTIKAQFGIKKKHYVESNIFIKKSLNQKQHLLRWKFVSIERLRPQIMNMAMQLLNSFNQIEKCTILKLKSDLETADLFVEPQHRCKETLESEQKDHKNLMKELAIVKSRAEEEEKNLLSEIQELKETMANMSDRLIELLKDKDVLWQKSDMLEFEQRLRAEERFEKDVGAQHCLDCKNEFSWMLRRHHCRLCSRSFCYYCCNNWASLRTGEKKERVCRSCFACHGPSALGGGTPSPSESPSTASNPLVSPAGTGAHPVIPRAVNSRERPAPDDLNFDIITEEEELCTVYEMGAALFPPSMPRSITLFDSNCSTMDHVSIDRTAEESQPAPLALEPEILLLKNSDPSFNVPLSPEDVRCFGECRRELHVKAGAYAVITMNVTESGLSLAWEFSSENRNVSFSVVWRDRPEQPVESSVVLIPLTRCNSHLQLVQGQLKARRPGLYLLIFDNSFSRFYGKKVSYHLTVSKTLMYDGTDET
uniref:FYVE and coiled-coil domain containing 1a n=1 Tax=Petromyzon marinus TaxID=7757 RepID=S4RYM5_PETMA